MGHCKIDFYNKKPKYENMLQNCYIFPNWYAFYFNKSYQLGRINSSILRIKSYQFSKNLENFIIFLFVTRFPPTLDTSDYSDRRLYVITRDPQDVFYICASAIIQRSIVLDFMNGFCQEFSKISKKSKFKMQILKKILTLLKWCAHKQWSADHALSIEHPYGAF